MLLPYSDIIKQYKTINKEIWLYTLIIILPVFRKTVFNVGVEAGTYSGGLNQSTSLALLSIGMTFFLLIARFNEFVKSSKYVTPLLLYYFFCFLSFVYVEQKFAVIFKSVEVISSILLTTYIIYKIKDEKVCLSYIQILCLTPIIAELITSHGHFHHTNTYSFSALLGLFICLGGVKYKIYKWKEVGFLTVFYFISIILGTSSASYLATIGGFLTYYSYSRKGIKLGQIILTCIIAFTIYHLFSDIIMEYVFYGKTEGEIEGGTGRIHAWSIYWEQFLKNPIIGYGFLVGERMGSKVFGININLISAHNTFISVIIGTGLIGLSLFLNFLIKWFFRIYGMAQKRNLFALVLMPVFVGFFINTNSFPALGSDWNYVGLALYALYAFTQIKLHK